MSAVSESSYKQDFIATKVKPLRRMKRSQIDRKVFRGMSSRAIIKNSLNELYVRHSTGFWQTVCVVTWVTGLMLVIA